MTPYRVSAKEPDEKPAPWVRLFGLAKTVEPYRDGFRYVRVEPAFGDELLADAEFKKQGLMLNDSDGVRFGKKKAHNTMQDTTFMGADRYCRCLAIFKGIVVCTDELPRGWEER